jgi:hypothetical protein
MCYSLVGINVGDPTGSVGVSVGDSVGEPAGSVGDSVGSIESSSRGEPVGKNVG